MVYGLSNDPLEALKGLKRKGATTTTPTPNFTTIKGKTTPTVGLKPKQQQLADLGGYGGGFVGITKPTIGSSFSTPAGADQTAMVNMPQQVQQRIVQEATQPKQVIDTTEPQFMETTIEGQITEQSPVQLYADLKAGMPVGEATKYYPEYADNLAMINELKADIDAGMPEAMMPQYYPEFYAQTEGTEEEQARGGGLKGSAAAFSPIDLGPTGETLINPVGRVAEIIDNQIQKIGSFDFTKTAEENLDKRVANLSQKELEEYQKKWEAYKKKNPGLSKMYTKTVEGKNLLAQMRNIVTGDTQDRSEVDAFKDFVRQNEKKFVEELAGADTKGPHFANMMANIPGSAVKTVSAVGRAILNPADTLAGLGKIIFTKEGRELIASRYGSREAFAKTLETDPIGTASDVLALVEGGAGLAKGAAKVTARVATKAGAITTAKIASNVATKAGAISKTAGIASDLGLRQILPKGVSAMVKATENVPVLNKITKYGQAMTTPLDTFVKVAKPIAGKLPNAAETLQRMNRMTAGDQRKFLREQGKTEGEWLNENIGVTAPVETVEILGDRVKSNIEQVNKAVEKIEGPQKFKAVEYTNQFGDRLKYQGDAVLDMAKDGVERARESNSPLLPIFEGLLDKYEKGIATMTDINKLQKLYQANTRMSYFKDLTAGNKTQRSTNIDTAVREWKMKVGEDYGFTNFREINKDTQASMSIIKGLTKWEEGKRGNNAVSLTDWIMIAPAMIEPTHLAGLVTKKVLQSNRFAKNYARILNKLNGHKVAAQKAADLITISRMNSEIEMNKRLLSDETNRLATTGLPSPETVTPSNLGTRKNPIKSGGPVVEDVEITGRKRNTIGRTDAPEIGDNTKLGKVVAVTHTSGGFPKYSVKIEGYRDFIPVEKIEGGIYEGTKESKTTTKPAEVMPREEETPKTEKDQVNEFGDKRKYYTQVLVEELGFKSIDDIEDIAIRNEIATIIRMKDTNKILSSVEELKAKIAGKEKTIPLLHKTMSNDRINSNSSNSNVDTVPLQRKADTKTAQQRSEGNARPARGADVKATIEYPSYIKKWDGKTQRFGIAKDGSKKISFEESSKRIRDFLDKRDVTIRQVDEIIDNMGVTRKEAEAMTYQEKIKMIKEVSEGTAEHEVVHAYIRRHIGEARKQGILDEVIKETGITDKEAVEYGYKDKYEYAEEALCDGFKDWLSKRPTSFSDKIIQWFNNLFKKTSEKDRLFRDINNKKKYYEGIWETKKQDKSSFLIGGKKALEQPKTGWFKGPDGEMKFEIDDSEARIIRYPEKSDFASIESEKRLSDYFKHDELFKQYPKLKDLPVSFESAGKGAKASYGNGKINIGSLENYILNRDYGGRELLTRKNGEWRIKQRNIDYGSLNIIKQEYKSSLIHEIQHAIQEEEGFARGDNSSTVGYENYRRSAGEVEARAVQRRIDMTKAQREITKFSDSYDISPDQQIVNKGFIKNGINITPRTKDLVKQTAGIDDFEMMITNEYDTYKKLVKQVEAETGISENEGGPVFEKKMTENIKKYYISVAKDIQLPKKLEDVLLKYIDDEEYYYKVRRDLGGEDVVEKLLEREGLYSVDTAMDIYKAKKSLVANNEGLNPKIIEEPLIAEARKYKSADNKLVLNPKNFDTLDEYMDFAKKDIRKEPNLLIAKSMGGELSRKKPIGADLMTMGDGIHTYIKIGDNGIYVKGGLEGHTYYLTNIAVEKKGMGLGKEYMNRLKEMADIYGFDIQVSKVANKRFFDNIEWLDTDYGYKSQLSIDDVNSQLKQIREEANKTIGLKHKI